jgi:heme/copper-type cytochrome/quinol oxidase subunit 2
MNTILSIPELLIVISVIVVLLCGGIFLWQCRGRCNRKTKTEKADRQTVWFLIGLLIVAVINMGIFLFTIFTEQISW